MDCPATLSSPPFVMVLNQSGCHLGNRAVKAVLNVGRSNAR